MNGRSLGMVELSGLSADGRHAHDGPTAIWFQGRADRLQEKFTREFEPRVIAEPSSIQLITGSCDVVFEGGAVSMGDYNSMKPFLLRLPAHTPHQIAKPENLRLKETMLGPDYGCEHMAAYLTRPPFDGFDCCRMIRTGEESYHTTDKVVGVSKREIEKLKAEVVNTKRKRIRLCLHANSNDLLHEMVLIYTKDSYVQPNKHYGKDESFHILEGEADFILYSDSGDVQEIIELGDRDSGKQFYVRVPADRYHTVVMRSDMCVVSEATPGPYNRDHTVWAPWAAPQAKDFAKGLR